MILSQMKKFLVGIMLIVFSVIFVYGCNKSKDFLDNGGFEPQSSLQKTPTGWYFTEMPKTKDFVKSVWDSEIFYRGKRSVSILIAEDHPEDEIAYNWTKVVENLEVGKSYELSCWVKGQNLKSPVWICVQSWDKSIRKMIGFDTTQKDYPLTGTFDWQQVGTVFTVPAGTFEVRVRAGIAAPNNRGGQAWFDELHIRQVN